MINDFILASTFLPERMKLERNNLDLLMLVNDSFQKNDIL